MTLNEMVKNLLLWLVIAVVLVSVFSNFGQHHQPAQQFTYTEFLRNVDQGNVRSVIIEDRTIKGITQNNNAFTTYIPLRDQFLLPDLIKKGVDVTTLKEKTGFDDKKVRNIVFRASKQGKIKKTGRGIYVGA